MDDGDPMEQEEQQKEVEEVEQQGGGGDEGLIGPEYFLNKLQEKAFSPGVYDRKGAAHDLLEAFRITCEFEDDVTGILGVIDRLACDPEHSVRGIVMEQLPQIALYCHEEGPHLDYVLPQHLIPHMVRLFSDKFTQVRKTSQIGLLLLLERGIVARSQVEDHIMPLVMELTSPAAHEDYRTEIAQFMGKLAPLLGKDLTIRTYLERFCHLCHDKLFQVRRVCASSIGDIATVVGLTLTEKVLINHFRRLCQDDVWGVRKACAETITVLSSCCGSPSRKGIITDSFVELLKDSSRWVRVEACQSLGPFITTFPMEDSSPSTPECSESEKAFLSNLPVIVTTTTSPVPLKEPPVETLQFDTWQYWRDPLPEIDLGNENNGPTFPLSSFNNHENEDVHNSKCQPEVKVEIETDHQTTSDKTATAETTEKDLNNGYAESSENTQIQVHSDVHRSYMNLFSASRRDQGFEDNGFEALKLCETYDDDDLDDPSNPTLSFDDEYASIFWGARTRPRLLMEIPKPTPATQDIVPEVLIEHFTTLCQNHHDHQTMDNEILSFCVYNLPAVISTLGPQNWSLLRDCYEALACSMQWKIRYTLASSLHAIGSIIGPELSERDLVPFYNATTKDVDEVRIGILRNLASFMKCLGSEAQKKCLETLNRFTITENARNWRFRLELADQIRSLSELYESKEVHKYLCPLSMELLQDRVSEVRKRAMDIIPQLMIRLNYSCPEDQTNDNDQVIVKDFLDTLVKTLGRSEVWVRRQTFAALAGQLIEIGAMSPHQFAQEILPDLVSLSKDKVPNVRLKVAQSIVLSIVHEEYFTDPTSPVRELLTATLSELKMDEDRDVADCSQLPDELDEEFSSVY